MQPGDHGHADDHGRQLLLCVEGGHLVHHLVVGLGVGEELPELVQLVQGNQLVQLHHIGGGVLLVLVEGQLVQLHSLWRKKLAQLPPHCKEVHQLSQLCLDGEGGQLAQLPLLQPFLLLSFQAVFVERVLHACVEEDEDNGRDSYAETPMLVHHGFLHAVLHCSHLATRKKTSSESFLVHFW